MRVKVRLLLHVLFWAFLMTAFWGSFEMAYKASEAGRIESPVWSGTFGFPVPHHYIVGFIGVAVVYVLLTREDFISAYRLLSYGRSGLEIKWEYVLGVVIVVSAAICLALGRMTPHDFIYIIGLVLSFLGGAKYGEIRARSSER